eukprot:4097232-Prymnesium_polylepis.1
MCLREFYMCTVGSGACGDGRSPNTRPRETGLAPLRRPGLRGCALLRFGLVRGRGTWGTRHGWPFATAFS